MKKNTKVWIIIAISLIIIGVIVFGCILFKTGFDLNVKEGNIYEQL